jgi:hypothetical protein
VITSTGSPNGKRIFAFIAHHDEIIGAEVIVKAIKRSQWCITDTIQWKLRELLESRF